MTHKCVGNLTIIGSDNGLTPGRCPANIWTNACVFLVGPVETNFNEISIGILTFSFKKMCLKASSAIWRPFCVGLNVLNTRSTSALEEWRVWINRTPKQPKWVNVKIKNTMTYMDHDDVIKWKHLPRYWPFVWGIHRSPVSSPHKSQWRGALMFSLICVWTNGWVNNREAGDLRRYPAHSDVTVMQYCYYK